jgi:hypothetical protein
VLRVSASPDEERWAQAFHETYERLAPSFGYETREASAVPWSEVPEPNKSLMIAVANEVLRGVLKELDEALLHLGKDPTNDRIREAHSAMFATWLGPGSSRHNAYKQGHDERCYICALLQQVEEAEVALRSCPLCGHEWSRHDPADGCCDAHSDERLGVCGCGRDMAWMHLKIAALSQAALSGKGGE